MSEVRIDGVTKTYPGRPRVTALRGVDLVVESGSLAAVLGPSGCGKTTLLRVIAGFESPDEGTVTIGGRVVARPGASEPPERRAVGIVPQEGALFPHLDVARNVAFGLRRSSNRRARVAELLELVGLTGLEKRRPDELSGGQQQRVALARALAPRPSVVLLDEPFAALDTGLRASLRAEVAATIKHSGATGIIVTHDQTEALTMADSLAIMRDGVIVQCGAPVDVYRHPVDVETARFLGEAMLIPGSGGTALLRPEQVVRNDASGRRARVVSISYHGHDALVDLDSDGERLLARWSSVDLPRVGDSVGFEIVGTPVVYTSNVPPARQ